MTIGATAKKESSTTNQSSTSNGTQTKDPWAAIVPYLTGPGGVAQSAAANFTKNGQASSDLTGALGDMAGAAKAQAAGAAALPGSLPAAQQVKAQYITNTPTIAADQVGVPSSFGALGQIDPTSAYKDLLSGNVTNSFLDQKLKANTDATNATYANLLSDATDSLSRNVLPAIRQGANLSGTYGGSRQGVAEGVALGNTNKQLGRSADSLAASLAGTNATALSDAYEAAQGRKASAAGQLGGLAVNTATGNADRNLTAATTNAGNAIDVSKFNVANDADLNKFNAGVTLNNNKQSLDAATTGAGLNSAAYDDLLKALTGQSTYETGQLGSYADIMSMLAGLGGNIASNENSTGTSATKGKSLGLSASYTYGGK